MSNSSRLQSHRNEASPSLFHSSLGSLNPLGLAIELARVPGADDDYESIVSLLGALLHERHHWLQQIGTVAGLFTSLLLETQAGLIAGNLPVQELTVDDLPLCDGRFRDSPAVIGWERVEASRRMFAGCRKGDFTALADNGRPPAFLLLADLQRPVVTQVCRGDPDHSLLRTWADLQPIDEVPVILDHRGWLVGTRHLMECAARISEVFKIGSDLNRAGRGPFNFTPLLSGIYGVAHDLFYDGGKPVSVASEIGLAALCDMALNGPYPPLAPTAGTFVRRGWSPGASFALLVRLTEGFRFDVELDPFDPAAVRQFLTELTAHVGYPPHDTVSDLMGSVIGEQDPDVVATEIFRLEEDRLPEPTMNGARIRYLFSIAARAFEIRREAPELFVFPFAQYGADRKAFRAHFDRLQPPLLAHGEQGLAPTRPIPGWLEFFLASSVEYELTRRMVMSTAPEIAQVLAGYARSIGGTEHGLAVIIAQLRSIFRGGPLGDELVRLVEAAVSASPWTPMPPILRDSSA
ncbi:hypothetical protein ACIBPB_00615 [Micromonospora sp. NPDC049836]|uniref:hypothetical protein n=1 Tax=Micromonospora sp. NPDC049836 TaxID=3364274 RepID=UPI0037A27961